MTSALTNLAAHLRPRLAELPSWTGPLVALLIIIIATGMRNPVFLRPDNLINILNDVSLLGIIAVGMTAVIILGGIDLSVGSLLAFAGGLAMLSLNAVYNHGQGSEVLAIVTGLAVALTVGAAAGTLNGLLIAKGAIPPFIATLAGLVAYRSAATWLADGGQYFSHGSQLLGTIGWGFALPYITVRGSPLVMPYPVLAFVAVVIVGYVVLNRTRLSRHIYAVGANEQAARYSAIAVHRVKIITYTLIGATVGLAAFLHAARYQSVSSSSAGQLLELYVIAAVVIGGTRMSGGAGSLTGTVIGVLIIGAIQNMLTMLNVTSYAHGLVMGAIIVAALLLHRLTQR